MWYKIILKIYDTFLIFLFEPFNHSQIWINQLTCHVIIMTFILAQSRMVMCHHPLSIICPSLHVISIFSHHNHHTTFHAASDHLPPRKWNSTVSLHRSDYLTSMQKHTTIMVATTTLLCSSHWTLPSSHEKLRALPSTA